MYCEVKYWIFPFKNAHSLGGDFTFSTNIDLGTYLRSWCELREDWSAQEFLFKSRQKVVLAPAFLIQKSFKSLSRDLW